MDCLMHTHQLTAKDRDVIIGLNATKPLTIIRVHPQRAHTHSSLSLAYRFEKLVKFCMQIILSEGGLMMRGRLHSLQNTCGTSLVSRSRYMRSYLSLYALAGLFYLRVSCLATRCRSSSFGLYLSLSIRKRTSACVSIRYGYTLCVIHGVALFTSDLTLL